MSITGVIRKIKDILFLKKEYVYHPKGGGPPIYIIGDGVLKIKLEDMYRSLKNEDVKAVNRAVLKKLGYLKSAEEKKAAEAAEAAETAPKNSLKRPEGAD